MFETNNLAFDATMTRIQAIASLNMEMLTLLKTEGITPSSERKMLQLTYLREHLQLGGLN